MADWMAVPLLHFDYGGAAPARVGLNHPSIAPYGAYDHAGGAVLISIQNDREWRAFAETVMEQPGLADDPCFATNVARVENRPALDAEINAVFATLDRAALTARLTAAKTAYGLINGVDGLSGHPQLRRITIETPSGPVELPASPALSDAPRAEPGAVPAPGQHTDAIREEFA